MALGSMIGQYKQPSYIPASSEESSASPSRACIASKKGDYVVILSGDYQGRVTKVMQCQKKEWKVKIIIDNQRLTYDFALVCHLTQVV